MLGAMASPFRVVLWGTYDQSQPRIRLLVTALRAQGCEVVSCHHRVWIGSGDKLTELARPDAFLTLCRMLFAYPVLLWRYCLLPPHDVVLVSHPGLLDALVIRPFAWLRRARLAWDVYVSPYDTVVLDRAWLKPADVRARWLWWLERLTWRVVDHPLADTTTHARRLEHLFQQPSGRCATVWVGAEALFYEVPKACARAANTPLNVLFYGTFLPLHGVLVVLEAARLLAHLPIRWTVIGMGPEASAFEEQLAHDPLPNMHWLPPVPYEGLLTHLHDADLVLGIFGTTAKAASVIPNKVYQALAAGKPLVTQDSPGARELLEPRPPWVYLVTPGDAEALAAAVSDFWGRALPDVAENPHRDCVARFSPEALGRRILDALDAPR